MNIVNLLGLLEDKVDYTTYRKIYDDFIDNVFQPEYKKLKPCKSAMEKAIRRYVSNATHKDEKAKGAYSEGHTILFLPNDIEDCENNIKKADVGGWVKDTFKSLRPTECYFFESVALYKALNSQEKQDYLLEIDDHFYSAKLVAMMLECITDSKAPYISAEIGGRGELFIKQRNAAIILPVHCNGNIHPSKNVNFMDFMQRHKAIQDTLLKGV